MRFGYGGFVEEYLWSLLFIGNATKWQHFIAIDLYNTLKEEFWVSR